MKTPQEKRLERRLTILEGYCKIAIDNGKIIPLEEVSLVVDELIDLDFEIQQEQIKERLGLI